MKNIIFLISILLGVQSCQVDKTSNIESAIEDKPIEITEEPKVEIHPIETVEIEEPYFDVASHLANYQKLKVKIKRERITLTNRQDIEQSQKINLAQQYISNILIDSVFQYWLSTPWDFNGYTNKPRQGEIACGYFVSTTLKHIGVPLNRYKVAQKAAANIIRDLCDTTSIQRYSTVQRLKAYLNTKPNNELFVIGLSNHVGFIYKRGNKNYFAHSNYINSVGVMIEELDNSVALKSSSVYYIGSITSFPFQILLIPLLLIHAP